MRNQRRTAKNAHRVEYGDSRRNYAEAKLLGDALFTSHQLLCDEKIEIAELILLYVVIFYVMDVARIIGGMKQSGYFQVSLRHEDAAVGSLHGVLQTFPNICKLKQ